jgi:ribosomal protein S18 acetylase RimI-like enzyme
MRSMRLSSDQMEAAVRVLARAFVTNPLHLVVFGQDALHANEVFFRIGLRTMTGEKRVVVDGEQVLGVAHWVDSLNCQFTSIQKLANSVALLRGCGLRSALKIGNWLSAWSQHDPRDPHVHLGPIAVDPNAQGCGIGGRLMTEFCERLDRSAAVGYLETDRPENVRFYGRYGFHVLRTSPVCGVVNYFMRRDRSVSDVSRT